VKNINEGDTPLGFIFAHPKCHYVS